jgi:integrase
MLRHGCGYALANTGHDTQALKAWLGHKNIQHTVRYTELAPDRFKDRGPSTDKRPDWRVPLVIPITCGKSRYRRSSGSL